MNEITAQEMIQEMKMHEAVMSLHIRALACYCECLGMNAENCQRAILNQSMVYGSDSYYEVMEKWGLIGMKGEPII